MRAARTLKHSSKKKSGSRQALSRILALELVLLAFMCGRLTVLIDKPETAQAIAYAEITDQAQAGEVAKRYLQTASYSKEGLINALTIYEHFNRKTAEEAVGSLSVDWQEQAAKEMESYLNMDGVSEEKLREYMERDLFTEEQIESALAEADPDWAEQAKKKASALEQAGVDKASLLATLLAQGFTRTQINNAL